MKKIIIIIQLLTIIILLILTPKPKISDCSEDEFYYMTSTGYSLECIGEKWNDGFTATMTPAREGIVAINVDWINEQWQIRSPLKLGQRIYIEGKGEFTVEDTGPFTETDLHFDFWNLDIFYNDPKLAKKHGRERIKVTILEEK